MQLNRQERWNARRAYIDVKGKLGLGLDRPTAIRYVLYTQPITLKETIKMLGLLDNDGKPLTKEEEIKQMERYIRLMTDLFHVSSYEGDDQVTNTLESLLFDAQEILDSLKK